MSDSAQQQLLNITENIAQITFSEEKDQISWKWDNKGSFTVWSAYQAMKYTPTIATDVPMVWSLKAPPRFLVLAWLMLLNRILTIDNLVTKGLEYGKQMCHV